MHQSYVAYSSKLKSEIGLLLTRDFNISNVDMAASEINKVIYNFKICMNTVDNTASFFPTVHTNG